MLKSDSLSPLNLSHFRVEEPRMPRRSSKSFSLVFIAPLNGAVYGSCRPSAMKCMAVNSAGIHNRPSSWGSNSENIRVHHVNPQEVLAAAELPRRKALIVLCRKKLPKMGVNVVLVILVR